MKESAFQQCMRELGEAAERRKAAMPPRLPNAMPLAFFIAAALAAQKQVDDAALAAQKQIDDAANQQRSKI